MMWILWVLLSTEYFAFPVLRHAFCSPRYPTTRPFTTALLAANQKTSLEIVRKDSLTDDIKPFDHYLQLLKEFVKTHGHARAHTGRHAGPLADWVLAIQNNEYPLYRRQEKGKICNETESTTSLYLNEDRVKKLSQLGFQFRRSWTWEERLEDLQKFKQDHGHVRIPRRYAANPSLGNWVSHVRQQYRDYQNGKPTILTIQKIQQLESLGFEWEIKLLRKDDWQQRIEELLEFKKQHGHCRVPRGYQENLELARWVLNLRQTYRSREKRRLVILSQERMDEMERCGFEWNTGRKITKWTDRVKELRQYANQHGHVRVPKNYPENLPLGRWVSKQRTHYRHYKQGKPSKLNDEQVKQLEAVGFRWFDQKGHGPWIEIWEQRLEELKEYQMNHDTIGIPQTDSSPLSWWCRYQRLQYQSYKEGKKSSLTKDQVRQLEVLGIDKFKDIRDQKWDARLEQLKEFRDEHGHCRVPQNYAPNPKLGNWVKTIRYQYTRAQNKVEPNYRLTDERMEQLREIGFEADSYAS